MLRKRFLNNAARQLKAKGIGFARGNGALPASLRPSNVPSVSWQHKPEAWQVQSTLKERVAFPLEDDMAELRKTVQGTCTVLSINRMDRTNSLTAHLCSRIERAFKTMNDGDHTTFLTLRGAESTTLPLRTVQHELDRVFCTGADLQDLYTKWEQGNREHVYSYLQAESSMVQGCINFTKPWAAGLSGLVTGAGLGLSMHALFRFASPYTVWAVTEPSYGGVPGYGASYELPRLSGELGTFLALTGRRLLGHDLYHAGLASHVIDPAHYEEMGRQLSTQWSMDLQYLLPILNIFDQSDASGYYEPYCFDRQQLECIASCFAHSSIPAIREALQQNGSDFARSCLRSLESKSPQSLALTLRLLRKGAEMDDIQQSMSMEHALQMRLWNNSDTDFHKGIKRLVAQSPQKWESRALPSDSWIESFFASPTAGAETLLLKTLAPRDGYEAERLIEYFGIQEDLRLAAAVDTLAEQEIARIVQANPDWQEPPQEEHNLLAEDEAPPPPVEAIVQPESRWFLIPIDDFMAGVALADDPDPWKVVPGEEEGLKLLEEQDKEQEKAEEEAAQDADDEDLEDEPTNFSMLASQKQKAPSEIPDGVDPQVLSFMREQADNARSGSMLGWDLDTDDLLSVDRDQQKIWLEQYGADLKKFVAVHATDYEVHPFFQGISPEAALAWRQRTRGHTDLPDAPTPEELSSRTARSEAFLQRLYMDPWDPLDVDEDVAELIAIVQKEGQYEGVVDDEDAALITNQDLEDADNLMDARPSEDDDQDEMQINYAPLTDREKRV